MASVIRLLPRKKVEKHVVPYRTLLSTVLSKRLRQAFQTTLYFVVLGAVLLAATSPLSLTRAFVSLTLIVLATLLTFKAALSPEPHGYTSKAAAIVGKLTHLSTYILVCGYSVGATLYCRGLLAPSMPAYAVEHAEPTKLPEGIPSSLALHKTDHWYVLNEQYLYASTFVYFLGLIFAACATYNEAHILRLVPAENGMKPLQRIKRRLSTQLKLPVVLWASVSLVWPVAYFLIIRVRATKPASVNAPVITLSGFHWYYVLLPVLALPLCIFWSLAYEILMAYLSLGPTYRGKPISDAARTDKNESLVNGISQNPASLSAFTAWHELLLIAEHDESRRKSIYSDVDGDRILWEKIAAQFQNLVSGQVLGLAPRKKAAKSQGEAASKTHKDTHEPSFSTTRTSTSELLSNTGNDDPLRRGTIHHVEIRMQKPNLYKSESAFEKKMAGFIHSLERKSTTRAQAARAYLLQVARHVGVVARRWQAATLATSLGALFRKPVNRVLAAKLHHPQTTAFAIRGVARMTTRSISEDEFGYVQSTIAATLASLDSFSLALEKTVAESKAAAASGAADSKDEADKTPDLTPALSMLGEVNSAFAEITEVFQPYFDNLQVNKAVAARAKRLAKGDLLMAKTAWIV